MEEMDAKMAFYMDALADRRVVMLDADKEASQAEANKVPATDTVVASAENEDNPKEESKSVETETAPAHNPEKAVAPKQKEEKKIVDTLSYVADSDIAEKLDAVMNSKRLYMQQDITVKDVAMAINTNHCYLSLYLNHILNLSFSEYINKLRIEREVLPLMKSDPSLPTKELIIAGNFAHRTTFYRAFQKIVGESFTDYRERLQKERSRK